MNKTRLLFRLGLALAVAGLVLAVYGMTIMPWRQGSEATIAQKAPFFFGVIGLAGGLILAVFKWLELRERTRLESDVDVLARWTLSPGELAAFHRADAARAALYPTLRNWLTLPASVPATGLPVVLSTDGLLVGGEFHGIGTRNVSTIGMPCEIELIQGEVAMLEITMGKTAFSDPTGGKLFDAARQRPFRVMRLPIAGSALAGAAAARDAIDAAIWTTNRDWARLTYAAHFAVADRDAMGREAVTAGVPSTPEPAPGDRSPEALAFSAIANVFGVEAAKAPTREGPAYRRAQAQFFGGVMGLAVLFGAKTVVRFDPDFATAMSLIWAVLFVIAAWFTVRGGWLYLVRRGN